jgi:hypothetical protein
MTANRYLFLGPHSWRFGSLPRSGDSFLVCRLADGPADINTLLLDDQALTGMEYWHLSHEGRVLAAGRHAGAVLSRLRVVDELTQLMPGESIAPLLVAAEARDATHFFVQMRTGDQDLLAMWCGAVKGAYRTTDHGRRLADMLVRGLRKAESNRLFLNNHQLYFSRIKPGTEIEYKLTVTSTIDLYDLSVHFRNLIGRAPLSGYIWEYRDDFEQWDFDNFIYEIPGPPEEAGYIAFMPDSRGTAVVKRKWFESDAVERRESKWPGVALTVPEVDYIRQRFGVESRYLGYFRRTRFDISLESVASGNIYALMIDRCRFDRDGWPDLCQIEVEYLKSRTLRASAGRTLGDEMRYIVDVARAELDHLGISYVESPLSKLTYMRQMRDGVHL